MFIKYLVLLPFAVGINLTNDIALSNDILNADLYSALDTTDKNVIYSPSGVHVLLALLYEASSGHTELALQNFLKLPAKSATAKHYQEVLVTMKRWSTLDIEMASKIYVRDSFRLKNSFVYLSKRFLVETAPLNMNNPKRAAEEVNDWIKARTNGRISQLIDKGDFYADTSSVVLNSIYFSADWMAKFDKKDTETTPFYVSSAKTVNCPMMRIWGKFYYREDKDLDAQVLQLPFRNAYFNLVIILPRDRTGIVALERTFTKPHFINFTKQSISYSHVDVYLPRFKIEATHELGEPLKELGLEHIFTKNAEFPNMIEGVKSPTVNKFLQKAAIYIDEQGGDASIITGKKENEKGTSVIFKADHPFLFLLTTELSNEVASYTNDLVLLMGKVTTPETIL